MKWYGLAAFLWQTNQLLAQAGVPSGQDDRNEGWGGMVGIGVVLGAVWLTMFLVKRMRKVVGRDEDEDETPEAKIEDRRSDFSEGKSKPTGSAAGQQLHMGR